MRNILAGFKSKFSKVNFKSKKIFIIVAIAAFILCCLYPFKSSRKTTNNNVESVNISSLEYVESLENRLVNVLESVKDVGNVSVLIMVDSSPTIKYLEESVDSTTTSEGEQVSQKKETTIVLCKNGSVTYPVVVVEKMPKITGVLIVASGAKDVKIKNMLINVASSVLSVDISKVEVLEGRK